MAMEQNDLFALNKKFETELNSANLSQELKNVFAKQGYRLSDSASLVVGVKDSSWELIDSSRKAKYGLKKNGESINVSENIHIVNQIVDPGLCVRCGACEPSCPVDIIKFNDQAYPYITKDEDCIFTCTRCIKVCPGKVVDYNSYDDEMFGLRPHPESITGIVRKSMVAYSTNHNIRKNGSSGGLVTQLLIFMLNQKLIDGALVMTREISEKGFQYVPKIARSEVELRKSQRSKYILVPHLKQLKEIEEVDGKYAIVALPCHIHSLKKYIKVSKKLRERVKFVIGLYCNVAYEPYLLDEVIEFSGYKKEDIINVEFRAGEWPGYVELTLQDGRIVRPFPFEEIKDAINSLKLFYTARRCNLCIDFSAEHADISVGDPWLRAPDGSYLFEDDRTTVLTRTPLGDEIIAKAVEHGYISVQEIPLKTYMVNFENNAWFKRDYVPKNMALRRLLGIPVPEYSRDVKPNKDLVSYFLLIIKESLLNLSKFKTFRRYGFSLFITKPAMKFFAWNRKHKKKKFAQHYAKSERFAERVMLKHPIIMENERK